MNAQARDAVGSGRPRIGEGQVLLGTTTELPEALASEQLAKVYRLNDPAFAEMALEPLLDELLNRIVEILSVDTVAILLLNEAGDTLVAKAAKGIEEEVEQQVRIPVRKGFAGRIAAERLPIFIPDVARADVVNPILRQKGLVSLLGVPLIVEADLVGVLHVGSLQPRAFTNEDATLLQLAAARAAPAIERARLFDELEKEHRGAMLLQRSLLPDRLPERLGAPVAARYFAARDEVGGDWYDVVELGSGDLGIAIGDVAGHGARAAALMGQLRTGLRAYLLDGYGPAAVLQRVDRLLQSVLGRGMATAICANFDLRTGVLRFASAGHPPPALFPPDGSARYIETIPGPPLGALRYGRFTESELTLGLGDIVLLYTDGLVERRGTSVDTGLDRLLEIAAGARSPSEICRQVVRQLVPPEPDDDIAFVALQRAPISEELALRLPTDPSALVQMRQALRSWLETHGVMAADVEQITLACGEACSNAIEHAYSPEPAFFQVDGRVGGGYVDLTIRDSGRWREPRGDNRGRGLTIMKAVMSSVEVNPTPKGTEVVMRRRIDA